MIARFTSYVAARVLYIPAGVLQRTVLLVSFISSGTVLQTEHIHTLFVPANFLHNEMPFPYFLVLTAFATPCKAE